jgi:hypothetical protein
MPSRKPLAQWAIILSAALILTGCTATGGPDTAPQEEAVAEQPAETPEAPPTSPSMPYSGVAVLPPVNDDPQQLMGLDRDALNEKLGEPSLIRRDGDAEVWQYRGENCVLDLFLYGPVKKVELVDLRNRGEGDEEAVRNCFVGLLRAALQSS